MKKTSLLVLLSAIGLLFSCSNQFKDEPHPGNGDAGKGPKPFGKYANRVILDWNLMALEAMGGPTYVHSNLGARLNAMTHLAMHDALNAIAPVYATYALQSRDEKADPIAAAASAAHTVLLAAFPDQQTRLDSALAGSLADVPDGDAETRGVALGKLAGRAIVDLRQHDGATENPFVPIGPSTGPGVYGAVPPFDIIFAPFWKNMQPFSLQRPSQFRPAPRPALDSDTYAHAFAEVKSIGEKNSPTRTADQTAYAKFWYEYSEIGWNRVTRVAAAGKKLDLLSTARLFALVNMSLVDSYTAGWDAKFHYNFWRPLTAIRAAETDGNPATAADARWEPLMTTPPVQDYPSTHSALGNAAATVLAALVGDKTKFTLTSTTADPVQATRSFNSFSQAAAENADSRVVAGIHFRFSCEAGLELGRRVGEWTVANHLRPLSPAR
jgi:uncharacterized protein (DUF3820 family)